MAVAEGATLVAVTWGLARAWKLTRPILAWMEGGGDGEDALAAWPCAAALPRRLLLANGWRPFIVIGVPVSLYATFEFDLHVYSSVIVFAGAVVAVAYAAILHYLASEVFMRPVLEDISRRLPPGFSSAPLGVPLRWKLLGVLPVINVVTGVVVSGLSTDGSASLEDLGLDVVVAVLVAFTVSLELTLLLTKSILQPVDDLIEATHAVKRGDLDVRVPVASGDELGELAGSFNEMMQGLSERQRLHAAFGSYVDPEVAERVLAEGELLEGAGARAHGRLHRHARLHAASGNLERGRDGRAAQRVLRCDRADRASPRRSREQVSGRWLACCLRRSRASAGPRRARRGGGAGDRLGGRRALRRRGRGGHRN